MNVRTSKRLSLMLSAILVLVLVLSACSGGSSSSSTQQPEATKAADSGGQKAADTGSADKGSGKPVAVSLFTHAPTNLIDLKTNWFTKYAEKTFNLDIKWVEAPASDFQSKQSLLLASGNYPDMFWAGQFNTADIQKYAKQGVLQPIKQELIQKYAPNVWKAIQEDQSIHNIAVAPDGNIYGLPSYNYCQHCYFSSKFWINTKLLNQYNLQMPTTTNEFEHVLQVFKDNGLIPLSGSVRTSGWHGNPITFLMNAFAYNVDNNNANDYIYLQDGKVTFSAITSEWRQGLQYMHDLYKKGLIDPQAFSQKIDGLMQEVSQNKVAVVPYGYSAGFLNGGTANPEYKYWETIPPLKGPNGAHFAAYYGNGYDSLAFVVTNKAKEEQIINVLKLINYIYTPEGQETMNFGQEGKFWKKAGPGEKGLDGIQALFITDSPKFYSGDAKQNEGWDQMGPIYQSKIFRNGFVLARPIFAPDGLESNLLYQTMKNYVGNQPKEVYPAASWIKPEDTDQYGLYRTNINKFVQEWMVSFIVGDKSLDKDWNSYVQGVQNLGLKNYLEMAQKAMQKPFSTKEWAQPDQTTIDFLSSLKE